MTSTTLTDHELVTVLKDLLAHGVYDEAITVLLSRSEIEALRELANRGYITGDPLRKEIRPTLSGCEFVLSVEFA